MVAVQNESAEVAALLLDRGADPKAARIFEKGMNRMEKAMEKRERDGRWKMEDGRWEIGDGVPQACPGYHYIRDSVEEGERGSEMEILWGRGR